MKDKNPDSTAVNGYGNLLGDIKACIRYGARFIGIYILQRLYYAIHTYNLL